MTAVDGEPRPRNPHLGWTVDDSTFGARLALVRQRMQWNIKEAARECGIPAASWGTWENGAMPRRYTEMCRLIAGRTGCSYVWLLDGPRLGSQELEPSLDEIAQALGIDPAELRSRVGTGANRDFDQAPAEQPVTVGQGSVGMANRVVQVRQPRKTPRPFSQPKPGPNRPMSAVPARKRRPNPVRPGDRPAGR